MAASEIKVDLRELTKALHELGPAVVAELLAIHKRVATTVSRRVEGLIPRGPTHKLAGTLDVHTTRRSAVVSLGSAQVPYAGPILWGWPRRHIAPQNALVDALESVRPQLVDQYNRELAALIEKVWG